MSGSVCEGVGVSGWVGMGGGGRTHHVWESHEYVCGCVCVKDNTTT